MAVFEYVAIGENGVRTRGIITAESARTARRELRLRRLSPLEVSAARDRQRSFTVRKGSGLSAKDLVLVTRQLAMLLRAGSTLEESLGAIAGQAERPAARRVLLDLRGQVQEGYSLSDALARAPKSFPPYYRAVVAAGLAAGRLGDVLERLAEHLEKSRKLTGKMLAALIYPVILAFVALSVIALLMVFVVPAVVEQFDTLGQDLPALTRGVIATSEFIRNWGWAVIALGGLAAWLLRRGLLVPGFRLRWDRFMLRLPLIGRVISSVNAAQFARTFATLSGSGATVPESLQAAAGSVSNQVFRRATGEVRRSVEEGRSLQVALRSANIFPPMLVHMVASGERGSQLPKMMGLAADYIEEELDQNATVALGLLEPVLIVFLAGVVAVIVLAIMLPILQLNTLALGV